MLVMAGLSGAVLAYDSDPGYGTDRPRERYGGDRTYRDYRDNFDAMYEFDRFQRPVYYVPTQRYYGNGYTVSYRYIPVFRNWNQSDSWQVPTVSTFRSSNFRTEAFRIETKDIPAWGANAPRITVKDSKTREYPAVTRIVPVKAASRTPGKSAREGGLAVVSSDPVPVSSAAKP